MKRVQIFLHLVLALAMGSPAAALDNADVFGGKSCNCYLDEDCASPLVCHTGIDCSEGAHVSKQSNPVFDSPTNNIGLCLEFGPHLPSAAIIDRRAHAIDLYLLAIEVAAGSGGGVADKAIVNRALMYDLTEEEHFEIRSLASHIAMLTLGPAPANNFNYVHRSGFFLPPKADGDGKLGKKLDRIGAAERELGSVTEPDLDTLDAFAHVRLAVAAEVRNPDKIIFRDVMSKLYDSSPKYRAFAACEYPHPKEHGHVFAFSDGHECLTLQIENALKNFNRQE